MHGTFAKDSIEIEPAILYLGTPVVLIGTSNEDGTFNLSPHPIVRLLAPFQRAGRQNHQEVHPCLNLGENNRLELPAINALHVHKHVVPVLAQILGVDRHG